MPESQVRDTRRELARRLEHEVLFGRSGHLGARTDHLKAQRIARPQKFSDHRSAQSTPGFRGP